MERDIIDIVRSKEYIQLSSSEKLELVELCETEDEFNQLKSVLINVSTMKAEMPNPKEKTKNDLDALFVQTYPKSAPIWYNSIFALVIPKDKPIYRQPLLQIAAIALLLLLAVPLFNSDLIKTNQLAKNEVNKEESAETIQFEDTVSENQQEVSNQLENEEESLAEEITSPKEESRVQNDFFAQPVLKEESNTSISGGATMLFNEDESDDAFFDHPDGIFDATSTESSNITMSIPASETEDLMDLLTVTF